MYLSVWLLGFAIILCIAYISGLIRASTQPTVLWLILKLQLGLNQQTLIKIINRKLRIE